MSRSNERFPGVMEHVSVRSSLPRGPFDHLRAASAGPVRAAATTQPVTMRFMLAERGINGAVLRSTPAVRANHKWVFPVLRGVRYHLVLCIELTDNAAVSVFPMESASHVVVEAAANGGPAGAMSQTLEIQSADAYYAGRGVLLLVPWDASEMLRSASVRELRVHLFTKVRVCACCWLSQPLVPP
jgi:hypothetical protein